MTVQKQELLSTPSNLTEVRAFLEAGTDAINIGHERFGLRLGGNFTLEEIETAVYLAHQNEAKVYVSVNNLMHNELLSELPSYITSLYHMGIDAILFGDPAVLVTAKEVAPGLKLHIDTETTVTSADTINYWVNKGVQRAILSRELTLDEVIEIKKRTKAEIQVQGHGMTCIFHSKRDLVTNYMQFQGRDISIDSKGKEQRLFLKETTRVDQMYPIFEDASGTHIMSTEDICMLEHLPTFIEGGIDVLKMEGILKPTDYNVEVIRLYRQAIDQYIQDPQNYKFEKQWLERLHQIQPNNRPLSSGFYFKELFY